MSTGNRVADWIHRRPFDRDVAIIGLVIAVLMLPLRFVLSHLFAKTMPLVLATACVLYLLAWKASTRTRSNVSHELPTLPAPVTRFAPSFTFFAIGAMVLVATVSNARTPLFHFIAAMASSSILFQVLFGHDDDLVPGLVMVQLVVLSGVIRLMALQTTAGFVGIDVWTHITNLAVDVQDAGSLSVMRENASRGAKYFASPLYHLLVVATALMAGTALETALYLSLAAGMVLTIPLVYAAGKLFAPARWALAATALYVFSDHAIKWGFNLIPTSLGVLFYIAGFYYFVRVLQDRDARDIAMLVFFMVAVTLSHQVSAFIMLVTIGTAAVVQYVVTSDWLYPEVNARDLSGLFVFQAGLLSLVWSITPYRGETFTEVMLNKLRETLTESVGLGVDTSGASGGNMAVREPTLLDIVIPYLNVAGFLLILGVAVLGCLYALKSDDTSLERLLLVFVITAMILFALFLPILGIGLFLPGRWYAFMYLPMAMLGALGLAYLGSNLNPSLTVAVFLLIALAYPAAMFVSTDATIDSPVFDHDQPRFSYTEAELEGMRDTAAYVPDEEPLYTDSPYTEVFRRTGTQPQATMAAVNPNTSRTVDDIIVYRNYHTSGAPIWDIGSTSGIVPVQKSDICGPDKSKIYANGDVTLCVGNDDDAQMNDPQNPNEDEDGQQNTDDGGNDQPQTTTQPDDGQDDTTTETPTTTATEPGTTTTSGPGTTTTTTGPGTTTTSGPGTTTTTGPGTTTTSGPGTTTTSGPGTTTTTSGPGTATSSPGTTTTDDGLFDVENSSRSDSRQLDQAGVGGLFGSTNGGLLLGGLFAVAAARRVAS
ncbi:hypothetical protein [Haloarchaeobius sp. DFWS5]|uniref:hypothetical protein n=1 Tax=Haloarchaeobius sp. DFWS5 TaxID=3446114 RepID=UPI003EB81406